MSAGSLYGYALDDDPDLDFRRAQRLRWLRERFSEYPIGDVEQYGRYVLDRGSGLLFERVLEVVVLDGDVIGTADAFYLDGSEPVFLRRPASGPGTLAELEEQQANDRRLRDEHEAARLHALASAPKATVTLADIVGRELPTLRQAAEVIAALQGDVEVRDGHVVVSIPEGLTDARTCGAAQVLVAASDVVIAALQANSDKPLHERLPDAHVLAGGGIG